MSLLAREVRKLLFSAIKAQENEDTLLPTQMFPRLPARATFVADTKNVSQFAQHGNTTFIFCPTSLRAQETS